MVVQRGKALVLMAQSAGRGMADAEKEIYDLLDRAEAAFRSCGVTPRAAAIRGGTDGAVLTWKGLPCPNLSTGGYNFHGVHEFIPVASLETMPRVLLHLAQSFLEDDADGRIKCNHS